MKRVSGLPGIRIDTSKTTISSFPLSAAIAPCNANGPIITGQSPVAGAAISLGGVIDLDVIKSPESTQDGVVNLVDFAKVANHWLQENCSDSDWCDGADINLSGDVELGDLEAIAGYWLAQSR